jgi:acyl carrier protein
MSKTDPLPPASLAKFESETIAILKDLTEDWDTGLGEDIGRETAIVADLEFESIDVVHLVSAIEQHYERSDLPFEELLMSEGRYIDDLTVSQIAEFLGRHLGAGAGSGGVR